ncbi:hypothetical protein AAFC00_000226 [Neodothiora populina]|uniref:Major facilitator superfamily (MFS) profile domain-containing protein n=1 Tax=Neodothiora populina TaxID=2781224 RepID=A0ABR3P2C3_9PEZI
MTTSIPATQTISAYFFRCCDEIGLISLHYAPLDTKLLCLQRFVRFIAYGGTTLILATYLSVLGNSDGRIGLFMTLTLVGDVVISFFLTLFADRLGRKMILVVGSLLMVGSGIVFGLTSNFYLLLLAAVFGVISPSGNEVGPFRAVEESTLAHLTPEAARGDIFAWYVLIGYAGTAIGTIVSGWVVERLRVTRGDVVFAYRVVFWIYAAMGTLKFLMACALSKNIEAEETDPVIIDQGDEEAPLLVDRPVDAAGNEEDNDSGEPKTNKTFMGIGRENLSTYIQLCLFFGLDSFASGLATTTWLTYYFHLKFNLQEGKLGSLFSGLAIIIALSVLVASSIAKRIGNIKAMAFTHLPSAITLMLIPLPSTVGPAIAFLIIRACSQSMDTAPRTAFLTAVIVPRERTAVMGFINVVKTMTQSLGPLVTGVLAGRGAFGVSFIIAGALKIVYDLGILAVFVGHKSQAGKEPEGGLAVAVERENDEEDD